MAGVDDVQAVLEEAGDANDYGLGRDITAEELAKAVMGSSEYIYGPSYHISEEKAPKAKPKTKIEYIAEITGDRPVSGNGLVPDTNTSHRNAMDTLVATLSLYYPSS